MNPMMININFYAVRYDLQKENGIISSPEGKRSPRCKDDCESDDDKYNLLCSKCDYVFTILPDYQIAWIMERGYRKYVCSKCTTIPDYLKIILFEKQLPILRRDQTQP